MPRPPADATDGELALRIQSAAAGAARAEEAELFRRFAPRVRLYARRHVGADRADDLVQMTMEIVINKLRNGEVREPERISSFALGCARMTAKALQRQHRRESPAQEHQLDALAAPIAPGSSALAAERLAAALAELSERERTVVTLSFYGGQSAAEIGEAVGTSTGNVRVIRHRAVQRLRRLMNVEEERDV